MGEYVDGGLIISVLSGLFLRRRRNALFAPNGTLGQAGVGDVMPYLLQMVLWGKLAAILYFPQAKLG